MKKKLWQVAEALFAQLPGGSRAAHTLLYVKRACSFRLDLDRQGKPLSKVETIEKLCNEPDDLLELIEYAFRERLPGKRLWLMYEGLETHSLVLPAAQVHGVGAAALTQALCFEIEALTGASMVNRQLGYVLTTSPDEEMRSFWASLLPQRLFDRLEKTVRGKRAKLQAVLHPGGLPVPLTQGLEPPWQRIEYWPEIIFCLAFRRRGEPQEVLVIPTEGLTRAAERELAEWLEDHPAAVFRREVLRADHKLALGEEASTVDLSAEEGLRDWLSAWGKVLARCDQHALALVQATARVEKELVYLIASGAFGATVVALHLGWQTYLKHDYENKTKELETIQKQMEEYKQGIKMRTEKLEAEQALDLLGQKGDLFGLVEGLRQRPARTLAALALTRPPHLVVTELKTEKDGWTVLGVSVDFSAPNVYASALEDELKPFGLKVDPPLKSGFKPGESSGPWRFSIGIKDLGLKGMRHGLVH